jgi:hypothetical protein
LYFVLVWRGIWALLDCYFLPDNRILSDWLTHGISLILLIFLNCSNSVLVRGVYIDAEEPEGQCVIFPVYYLRLFFQKERTKKQKRLNNLNEKNIDQHNTALLIEKTNNNIKIVKMMNDNIEECTNESAKEHQVHVLENGEHKISLITSDTNNE